MGCDYFIFQYLKITHAYGIAYIELSCDRGYYCNCMDAGYDSDTNDQLEYEERIDEIKQLYLRPSIQPILIYDQSGFITERFEEKYDDILSYTINEKRKYWRDTGDVIEEKEDIMNIYKIEIRDPVR
jgi:hypothetical protein